MKSTIPKPRRRRRPAALSRGDLVFQSLILLLVLMGPMISFAVLGGARIWLAFPLMILTFLGGFLWLVINAVRGQMPAGPPIPGIRLMAAWLVFAALHAWQVSVIPGLSVNEWLHVLAYTITYFTLATLPLARRWWKEILGAYLMLVSLVAWYGLIQYAHEPATIWIWPRAAQYGTRVSSTFICPNHFAHFTVMGALMGLAVASAARLKAALRIIGGYTFVVCLPGIYLSLSRSGWIGLVAGLGVFILLMAARVSWKRVVAMGFAAAAAFCGLFAVLYAFSEPFHKRIAEAMRGDIRLNLWPDSLSLIQSAPWTGYGGGSYQYVIGTFRNSFSYPELYVRYAHNEYLHALAEYGIPGLVLILLLLSVVVYAAVKGWRQSDSPQTKTLLAGWLAVLTATGAHCIFDFNLHMFANVMLLSLFAAVMVTAVREPGASATQAKGLLPRLGWAGSGLLCLGAALASIGIVQSQRYFLGSYAKDTLLDLPLREQRLIRSTKWNPWDGEPARVLGHYYKTRFTLNRNPEQKKMFGEKAMDAYAHAVRANAWDTEAMYGKSWVLFQKGEPEAALALMKQVTLKEPFSAFYYMQYGVMLRKAEALPAAREAFKQAAILSPKHQGIRTNLRELNKILK